MELFLFIITMIAGKITDISLEPQTVISSITITTFTGKVPVQYRAMPNAWIGPDMQFFVSK